ncbi:hypothetical protein BGX27_002730, partial [Mortierella sp. AM989]
MSEIEEKESGGIVPPTFCMSYDDVRKTVYRQRIKESWKSLNTTASVQSWIKAIEDDGGEGTFIEGISGDAGLYMFAWSTKFQLKSLKPDPENKKRFASAYLFTLLVKDVKTQLGVPIAFMVCNSESTHVLRTWLTWVKEECGLEPSKFMIDCSVVKTEALKQTFRLLDIYYCKVHVGQAWEQKMRNLHSIADGDAMRKSLNGILNALSDEDRGLKWKAFTTNLSPSADTFIAYLKKWMEPTRLTKWALYLRS